MTKSELIAELARVAQLPKGRAEAVVQTVFDAMKDALVRGEGIEIRGFGTMTVRHYEAYEGRNPRTNEPVHVPPKRLPYFKPGKELRERVQNGRTAADRPSSPAAPSPARSRRRSKRLDEETEDAI